MTKAEIAEQIKSAFEEGYGSYATPAAPYNTVSEAWEESGSKVVHDYLIRGESHDS